MQIHTRNCSVKNKTLDVYREVDFYLKNESRQFKCEVKLMGQGNPESADAIIARDSDLFVADTLSAQNKAQCDERGVLWIACRDKDGYKKFADVLAAFEIPHEAYNGDVRADVPRILDGLLK